jgi:hypothetical protein
MSSQARCHKQGKAETKGGLAGESFGVRAIGIMKYKIAPNPPMCVYRTPSIGESTNGAKSKTKRIKGNKQLVKQR